MSPLFEINLPTDVKYILNRLQDEGYEAYIVGGCVRDSILGIMPHDWDITTSAKPEEVLRVFHDRVTIPTGLKHGTITVVMSSKNQYEITTFRTDGEYSDGRHPDNVEFVSDLAEDLKRRDFTMNAIAYNPTVGLVDMFDGFYDIMFGLIKCVGNPKERFDEDALRIMRAIRFQATLGFTIETDTWETMYCCRKNLQKIAKERIGSEFMKMFRAENCIYLASAISNNSDIFYELIPEMRHMSAVMNDHRYISSENVDDVFTHTIEAISQANRNEFVRLALLFHDIGKVDMRDDAVEAEDGHVDRSMKIAKSVMERYRFDNNTINIVCELIKYHEHYKLLEVNDNWNLTDESRYVLRRIVNKMQDCAPYYGVCDVWEANVKAHSNINKYKILSAINCASSISPHLFEFCKLKDLKINGNDLIELGFSGKAIGDALTYLMDSVLVNQDLNEKKTLINLALALKEAANDLDKR